jgi:hypothetical protein
VISDKIYLYYRTVTPQAMTDPLGVAEIMPKQQSIEANCFRFQGGSKWTKHQRIQGKGNPVIEF